MDSSIDDYLGMGGAAPGAAGFQTESGLPLSPSKAAGRSHDPNALCLPLVFLFSAGGVDYELFDIFQSAATFTGAAGG